MQNSAAVCPGQGSQSVGMLSSLAERSSVFKQTFEEASEAISMDLWKLVQEGPADALNLTQNTQPSLVAASVAVWRYLQSQLDWTPNYVAGHSLGEFSALVLADSLSLTDAVKIVFQRGRLMSEALMPGAGGMAAVLGLDEHVLQNICRTVSATNQVVCVANLNAPGQVVLAGHKEALESAMNEAKAQGAKRALLLPVSGPFHSPLMSSVGERLAEILAQTQVHKPKYPIIQNVNNEPQSEPNKIREHLVSQVTSPVDWVGAITRLKQLGVGTFVEVGAGKVLAGLNKRIDRDSHHYATHSSDAVDQFLEALESKTL